mmetsp:Transcript_41058/g.134072  ORF Transcript_41058/g.134072 Transcript_41058/m.134072 type:complete len:208 (+) Transcript_41058:1387-2010(+)
MPTKTPVRLPASPSRRSPAPCSASYPRSSSSRCCGSIAAASAGETPKKAPSKSSTPRAKPPCRTRLDTASPAAESGRGPSGHRSAGTSEIRSAALMATRHTASAPAAPEGSTALTPVTSTATRPRSCAAGARCSGAAGSGVAPSDRYAASCRALGWSKTSVLGSAARPPTAACSWLRSSTAPSESRPDSISGASGSTSPPVVCLSVS